MPRRARITRNRRPPSAALDHRGPLSGTLPRVGTTDPHRGLIRSARQRAVAVFSAFASGLVLARALADGDTARVPSLLWFAIAAVLVAAMIVLTRRGAKVAGLLACLSIGAAWWTYRIYEQGVGDLARQWSNVVSQGEAVPLTIEGIVLDQPVLAPPDPSPLGRFRFARPRWRFVLDADRIVGAAPETRTNSGARVWISVQGETRPACVPGDRVRITGVARGIEPPRNPGDSDLRLLAAERGWAGSLSSSDASLILPLDDAEASLGDHAARTWWRARAVLRERAERAVDAALGTQPAPEVRALVRGLVLGLGDPAEGELFTTWAKLGLAHVLSISGFHLAILAGLTLFLLRLTGDRGWLEPAIVAAAVVAYAAILPPDSPILRSAAMVVLLLLSEALGRRYDRLVLLIWIAIGLLVWRPLDLWSLGYQMSIGLTALLIWSVDGFRDAIFGEPVRSDVPRLDGLRDLLTRGIQNAVAGGISCGLVGAPLVLFRTGIFSPLGLIATMIVTPIVVGVLWVTYVALLAGMVWAPFAAALGPIVRWAASGAINATARLAELPAAWSTAPAIGAGVAGAIWTFSATGLMLWLVRASGWRQPRWWMMCACVLAFAGALWWRGGLQRDTALRVDMLAVGDGSSILVRSGRHAVLWDCGSLADGGPSGSRRLVNSLRTLGVWNLPTVFITHPDIDHFGLLPGIVEPMGVRRVVVPRIFLDQAENQRDGAAAALIEWLARRGVEVQVMAMGDVMGFGKTRWSIVSPPEAAPWRLDNDHSIVAMIEAPTDAGARRVLLTGDIQAEAIARLRAPPIDLPEITVIEAPHHGAASPAAIDWLTQLRPRVVHQSTGPLRVADERWRLLRSSAVWWTTCVEGASWSEIRSDGSVRTGALRAKSVTVLP